MHFNTPIFHRIRQSLRRLSRATAGMVLGALIVGAAARLEAARQMEALNRGVVAIPTAANQVFVSWRLLGTEAADTGFNLYRSTAGGAPQKLNPAPLTAGTHFLDTTVDLTQAQRYFVKPLKAGVELSTDAGFTLSAGAPVRPYLSIPMQLPAAATMPDGTTCTYSPNDASAGDLDGDGEYELVVKWDPSNSKDNSQNGYTGNVYLDAYKLDGRLLWRIDLGRNIRAGAHYTQFMVYDLDGDGRAEIACKTADASVDGMGRVIGDATKDHRTSTGTILSGREYLSVFAGATGAELARTDYIVPRHPTKLEQTGSELKALWGDDYGNRVDRFLAAVAYLDGRRPSLVMCRGYYTRTTLCAWDFRDGKLTRRWLFDSDDGTPGNPDYRGQGNHNLTVADVDGDGRDEIVYGACVIDDDGKGLYTTKLGHGDAMHVSDMDPDRPGLEQWGCHEDAANNGNVGLSLRDARTGAIIFKVPATTDIGRALAMDIDPRHRGYECWGAGGGNVYNVKGQAIGARMSSMNFGVWWDGDLLREILDSNTIDKWDYEAGRTTRLLTATGCTSNNGTKSTPALSADLFGDWREEVVWRSSDNRELRIYTTTIPTEKRLPTLMHDPQYRIAVAWQNVAYNQPPHPSYYLGDGMGTPPRADITTEIDTSGGKLVNLSMLAQTGGGDARAVAGFTIGGTSAKRVLLRAVGPTLALLGVANPIADPTLELYQGENRIHENQDWGTAGVTAADFSSVQAFALPAGSKDAALLVTLLPGTYTVHAYNATSAAGRVLVEVYELP